VFGWISFFIFNENIFSNELKTENNIILFLVEIKNLIINKMKTIKNVILNKSKIKFFLKMYFQYFYFLKIKK